MCNWRLLGNEWLNVGTISRLRVAGFALPLAGAAVLILSTIRNRGQQVIDEFQNCLEPGPVSH